MKLSFPPKLRQLPVAIAAVYTTLFVAWYLATAAAGSDQWLLALTNVFGSWVYLPLWLLLLWALWQRRWVMLPVLLLPLLLFGYDYGVQFLPQWSPPIVKADGNAKSEPRIPLRVVSWNAYFRNNEVTAFVDAMQELQPDLVAIQEINVALTAAAQSELRTLLPYQEHYPTGSPTGMALLSRYPIQSSTVPDFQHCNCLSATINVDGQAVTVFTVHPWPPDVMFDRSARLFPVRDFSTAYQDSIFDALLERIAVAPRPLLVLGDLNTGERQPNYQRMRVALSDAFVEAGWGMGYTFPTVKRVYGLPVFPVVRIDYIFHDAQWQADRAWVGTIPGADHRYVAADLVLITR